MSDQIEEILKRGTNKDDNGERLRGLHQEVAEEITLEELKEYLRAAKKGTAPGVSGVPIEMWWHAPEEALKELVDIMNIVMESGRIPEAWEHRVIRPLAKTETAVGLNDIRPITLLEVSQKILTGIITIKKNSNSMEHKRSTEPNTDGVP